MHNILLKNSTTPNFRVVKYINCVSKEVYELGENAFLMKKYVQISQLK